MRDRLNSSATSRRLRVWPGAVTLVLWASAAWANVALPEPARDLSRYKEEAVPGGTLLVIAYLIMWALVGGYAVRIALRQSRTERELAALQERLDRDDATQPPSSP